MRCLKEQTANSDKSGSGSGARHFPATQRPVGGAGDSSIAQRCRSARSSCALLTLAAALLAFTLQLAAPAEAAPMSSRAASESLARLLGLLRPGERSDALNFIDAGDDDDSISIELSDDHNWADSYGRQRRHRKRQSDVLYVKAHSQESDDDLEWSNPCGGVFLPAEVPAGRTIPMRHYLQIVNQTAYFEYTSLNERLHSIDISDIAIWRSHKHKYRFLPTLNARPQQPAAQPAAQTVQTVQQQPPARIAAPARHNKIALKRWYRNVQVYVATFAFLGRTQHKWERTKQLPVSDTSRELNELLLSARRLLCELEGAINGSFPDSSKEKLNAITRQGMNTKLHALIERVQQQQRESGSVASEAATPDLKFAKYHYYRFLMHLWSILDGELQRRGEHIQQSDSSQSNAADDNQSVSLHELGPLRPSSNALAAAAAAAGAAPASSAEGGKTRRAGQRRKRKNQQQRLVSHAA